MFYTNYLFLTILVTFVSAKITIPSFIRICHQSNPHLNMCIKNSVDNLRPLLAKGIPEFSIPSCEPLFIPEVIIDQGSGPVSVRSIYKDIKVHGPSRFILRQIKLNLEKNKIVIKLWLPRLELFSKYTMDGRILMMPISGIGISEGNYSNIDATLVMQGQRIQKDHEKYFHIKDFSIDFNIGHASIQLHDLFNGDKELGNAMNSFLNDNWKSVANEIQPVLEDTIASLFKKFANKIFHKYPLDLLLPK